MYICFFIVNNFFVRFSEMKNKKLFLFISISIIIATLLAFTGCGKQINTEDYIRIHIRADSNEEEAQKVKLLVRDEVVGYLSAKADGVKDKNEMLKIIENELETVKIKADKVLKENGFDYTCSVNVRREDFPEKTYGDLTLPAGNYLALIVELGRGKGNNWWCVAYPPLCFIASEEAEGDKVEYRSKIAEFFKNLGSKK